LIVTQQEANQWMWGALERMEGSMQCQDTLNERRTAAIEHLNTTHPHRNAAGARHP
jgi:hypothetical protein